MSGSARAHGGHPSAINFCVGDRASGVCGYAWRLGWSSSSFYLKLRHRPLSRLKISLHSPDPGKGRPGFKIGLDSSQPKERIGEDPFAPIVAAERPSWFPGHEIAEHVTHVLRFRSTWDLFSPGRPSGPSLGEIKAGAVARLLATPPLGYATDLDIYVSSGRPFWLHETQARADNACLGPLRNSAGQYVTGVAHKRAVVTTPTPEMALAGEPIDEDDRTRGIGTAIDPDGFLWIREQWMSKAALVMGASHLASPPG